MPTLFCSNLQRCFLVIVHGVYIKAFSVQILVHAVRRQWCLAALISTEACQELGYPHMASVSDNMEDRVARPRVTLPHIQPILAKQIDNFPH